MNSKIFIKVFFEKPKYMIMYSLSIVTFWYALFISVNTAAHNAYYEKNMPDIEIYGPTYPEDTYMLYKELDTSVRQQLVGDVKSYGMTVRNLYTFTDAYYHVSYRIFAAEDEFLQELKGCLRRGKLPEAGKTEALIGYNAAKFYGLEVGDVLDFPITLSENGDASGQEYTVSGIIKADASFFSDGIYISGDTCESMGEAVAYNTLYLYTESDDLYKSVVSRLEGQEKTERFGGFICHYDDKESLDAAIRKALVSTIPLSAIVLTVIFVSLMKYTGRKIGLMKALGVSDRHIMRLLAKGFGIYNLAGLAMSFLGLGFAMLGQSFPVQSSVILYSVYSFGIIYMVTIVILFVLCIKISPRLAMYPY